MVAERSGNASTLCRSVGIPRATYYRLLKAPATGGVQSVRRSRSHRSLTEQEKKKVIDTFHELRFADKSPAAVYAALLDDGIYLCSISTMYRILRTQGENRERRPIINRPNYQKPELLATAPNQVWSWDITKLKGPVKWTYYYLYVILDIYSRYVVGWLIAPRESAELAKHLIEQTCDRQRVRNSNLIIHSDRGTSMTSKTVAMLYSDLGITKSLNRPHVSNDNPYSESQFKTLKYQPTFPGRFGSLEDARGFCKSFFDWYNNDHYHSGIALMTPATVHFGLAEACNEQRQQILEAAFASHPERFVRGVPRTIPLPEAAWINPPAATKPSDQPSTALSISIISSVR